MYVTTYPRRNLNVGEAESCFVKIGPSSSNKQAQLKINAGVWVALIKVRRQKRPQRVKRRKSSLCYVEFVTWIFDECDGSGVGARADGNEADWKETSTRRRVCPCSWSPLEKSWNGKWICKKEWMYINHTHYIARVYHAFSISSSASSDLTTRNGVTTKRNFRANSRYKRKIFSELNPNLDAPGKTPVVLFLKENCLLIDILLILNQVSCFKICIQNRISSIL